MNGMTGNVQIPEELREKIAQFVGETDELVKNLMFKTVGTAIASFNDRQCSSPPVLETSSSKSDQAGRAPSGSSPRISYRLVDHAI